MELYSSAQARARIVNRMVTNALGKNIGANSSNHSRSLWSDLMPVDSFRVGYMASIKQQRHRLSWQWHERLARRDVVTVMLRNLKLNSQNMYFTLYYVLMRDMWNA